MVTALISGHMFVSVHTFWAAQTLEHPGVTGIYGVTVHFFFDQVYYQLCVELRLMIQARPGQFVTQACSRHFMTQACSGHFVTKACPGHFVTQACSGHFATQACRDTLWTQALPAHSVTKPETIFDIW